MGEEQAPGCVAGWKDNVVWEEPFRAFTRREENTRALPVSIEQVAELPRELGGSLPQQQAEPGSALQHLFLKRELNKVLGYYTALYLITIVTASHFCATVQFKYLCIPFRGWTINEDLT